MFMRTGGATARGVGDPMSRMLRRIPLFMLLSASFVVGISCGRGGGPKAPDTTAIPDSWQDHEQRLALVKAKPVGELTDTEKLSLISWLSKDADTTQQPNAATGASAGEDYGEYLVDLALTVARLKDKRALPALVKVMGISRGICTTIAEFGDDAVSPVMAQLNRPEGRWSAVATLGLFLKGQRLGKNSLSMEAADRIQKQLLALTGDPSGLIRMLAVQSLAFAKPNPDSVGVLQKIANEDPYEKSSTTDGATTSVYPVREEATATLKAWMQ